MNPEGSILERRHIGFEYVRDLHSDHSSSMVRHSFKLIGSPFCTCESTLMSDPRSFQATIRPRFCPQQIRRFWKFGVGWIGLLVRKTSHPQSEVASRQNKNKNKSFVNIPIEVIRSVLISKHITQSAQGCWDSRDPISDSRHQQPMWANCGLLSPDTWNFR